MLLLQLPPLADWNYCPAVSRRLVSEHPFQARQRIVGFKVQTWSCCVMPTSHCLPVSHEVILIYPLCLHAATWDLEGFFLQSLSDRKVMRTVMRHLPSETKRVTLHTWHCFSLTLNIFICMLLFSTSEGRLNIKTHKHTLSLSLEVDVDMMVRV